MDILILRFQKRKKEILFKQNMKLNDVKFLKKIVNLIRSGPLSSGQYL